MSLVSTMLSSIESMFLMVVLAMDLVTRIRIWMKRRRNRTLVDVHRLEHLNVGLRGRDGGREGRTLMAEGEGGIVRGEVALMLQLMVLQLMRVVNLGALEGRGGLGATAVETTAPRSCRV